MSVTSVRLEDDVEQLLASATENMHRSKGWIINEALRIFLTSQEQEKQRWEDTLEALEDIRMGRTIDGNKVHAWLETWGTEKESTPPKK